MGANTLGLFVLMCVALVWTQAGGWLPKDPTQEDTVNLAKFAVDQVNKMDESSCYLAYDFLRVVKAYRQLVSGFNYAFEVEVNTSMKGLCHVHYSEGVEILKELVVYQDFSNNTMLTRPENKESLIYAKEAKADGQSCTANGDAGCYADSFCNSSNICQARISKGEDCVPNQMFQMDDECAIGFYCQTNGDRKNCLQAPP